MKSLIAILLSASLAFAQSSNCATGNILCRYNQGTYRINSSPADIDLGGRCPQSSSANELQSALARQGYCVLGASVVTVTNGPIAGTWVGVDMYNPAKNDRAMVVIGRDGQQTYVEALQRSSGTGYPSLSVKMTSDDVRLSSSLDEGLAHRAGGANGSGSILTQISPQVTAAVNQTVQSYLATVQAQEMVRAQEEAYQKETTYRIDQQNLITISYRNAASAVQGDIGLVIGALTDALPKNSPSITTEFTDAEISIDASTQQLAADVAVEEANAGDWRTAVKNINALFDPRLKTPDQSARQTLAPIIGKNGLINGPSIGGIVDLKNKSLMANLRAAANWTQAGALSQGKLIALPDRKAWVRAAVNYVRAGEIAAHQGYPDRAADMFDRAQKIGRALAGSEERSTLGSEDIRTTISRGDGGSAAWDASAGAFSSGASSPSIQWTPDALAYASKYKTQLDFLQSRADRFREFLYLPSPVSKALRDVTVSILNAANYRLSARDFEGVSFLAAAGMKVFDVSTYFTPTHLIGDVYGLAKGVDFETGRKLTDDERLMSAINIACAWKLSAKSVMSMAGIEREAAASLERRSLTASEQAANAHLEKMFGKVKFETAESVNAQMKSIKPPYLPGTLVANVELTAKTPALVRVHQSISAEGVWLAEKSAIEGLSPRQIQAELALPTLPTHISDVQFPASVEARRGVVNGIFGGKSGAIQYEIKNRGDTKKVVFTNTREL